MKIVDLKCPNCSGNLTKEGDNLICSSCGAAFAIDYDDSDVEYEKLQSEAEREARQLAHEKELLEKEYELKRQAEIESEKRQQKRERQKFLKSSVKKLISSIISLAFLFAVGFGFYKLFRYMQDLKNAGGSGSGSSGIFATPTPAPNYDITPADIEGQMDEFIKVGKTAQMKIDQCAYWGKTGSVKYYDKKSADFVDAYIINDIPGVDEEESNRLVLIYKVKWQNGKSKKTCYDAVYFEGLRVNPKGGVISDFKAATIERSDAAWGWAMAYSFEEYDQCYRENVKALGGTVTKIGEETK